jgi:hypothetical protein
MPIAMIQRMPPQFSTETYDRVASQAGIEGDPPHGLISHVVAISDTGAVILDVWDSIEDYDRFRDERLNPALRSVIGEQAAASLPMPRREFLPVHRMVSG